MKKEFNLSERLKTIEEIIKLIRANTLSLPRDLQIANALEQHLKDVKEFIQRLKDEILQEIFNEWEIDEDVIEWVFKEIDKLAGDDLK